MLAAGSSDCGSVCRRKHHRPRLDYRWIPWTCCSIAVAYQKPAPQLIVYLARCQVAARHDSIACVFSKLSTVLLSGRS